MLIYLQAFKPNKLFPNEGQCQSFELLSFNKQELCASSFVSSPEKSELERFEATQTLRWQEGRRVREERMTPLCPSEIRVWRPEQKTNTEG